MTTIDQTKTMATIQVSPYISVHGELVPSAPAAPGKVAVLCNGDLHFGTLLSKLNEIPVAA